MNEGIKSLTIKINPNNPEATVSIEKGGIVSQKTVSIDDLTASLGSVRVNTGILPKGTRYFAGGGTNFVICVETAPRIRNMAFSYYSKRIAAENKGEKYEPDLLEIPFPTCLFKFTIKGSRIADTKIVTVKQTLNTVEDLIYRFPFGNTYRDGKICWGNNSLPRIDNPLDVVSIMATFFDAPFNGDLLDHQTIKETHIGKTVIKDTLALINYLKGKEKFPEDTLYQIDNFRSFIGENNEQD